MLFLSTYELGTEPLGIIGAASFCAAAGHEVRCCDLAISPWPSADVAWADAVAISVPMHTALRLGLLTAQRLKDARPDLPVAYYGMYGPVAEATGTLGPADLAIDGTDLSRLLGWTATSPTIADRSPGPMPIALARAREGGTVRSSLPGIESYARLVVGDVERFVGTVESTTGCNHRCRHCPVPTVFDGRSHPVDEDEILAEIDQRVEAGATHIHFADPDFLNRPPHALRVVRALHARYREVTFDATIKVSHILRHRDLFPELGASGMLFCVSAVESTSPTVLARLDKGHVSDDAVEAVSILRRSGIELRPSLLPFTPWTTRDDLIDLVDFIAATDLIANVDPVHYGIRLLIPPRSLLLGTADPVLMTALGPYDPDELGYRWTASDPLLDDLQRTLAQQTERASLDGSSFQEAYAEVRATIFGALGRHDAGMPELVTERGPAPHLRARLSESWFCCAEPTADQMVRLTAGAPAQLPPPSSPVQFLSRRPEARPRPR